MFNHRNDNHPESANASRRLGMSLLAVGLAVGVHAALHSFLPKQFPFLPFAAAILLACRWAGPQGGLTATIASAFVLRFWFLPPAASFLDERSLGLGLFVAAGLCVTWQQAASQATRGSRTEDKPQSAPEPPPFEYVGAADLQMAGK
jgi:hypothetical protein